MKSFFILAGLLVRWQPAVAFLSRTITTTKPKWKGPAVTSGGETSDKQTMLITFDLDDTLFPIQPVVDAANDAQIRALHALGYTETSMEQCMVQTRAIRQSLMEPITYTNLRKGAIQAEIQRLCSDIDVSLLQQHVEHCFDSWLQERHAASEKYLFPEAIDALKELKSTFLESHDLCVAAITNGRGNPLSMTSTLKPFFDFCVSGEDDDVFPHRKPHPAIYEAALQRWSSIQKQQASARTETRPDVWLHIGDCLANDVGASREVGAHAVWVAPALDEDDSEEQPSWSTATKKDRAERAILMEAARSKVSGQIADLSELTSVVQQILEKQSSQAKSTKNSMAS